MAEEMLSLTIDGREVKVPSGQSILQAAKEAHIEIPTLCNDERLKPFGACRLCLVEIQGAPRPTAACTTPAAGGMVVQTDTEKLRRLRKAMLELLFSDHNAYCSPPCRSRCPTRVNIPGFLCLMDAGRHRDAVQLLKEVLPFPAILGRICPRPCQIACRRSQVDEEISICQMHGYAGEQVLADPPLPWPARPPSGKKVAIIGAGPAGLTAAYYLALAGHEVTIYEALPLPGGMLRYGIPEYRLPKRLLDDELQAVWQLGVELRTNMSLGQHFTIDDLMENGFQAVFLAVGAQKGNAMDVPGEDLPGVISAVDFLRQVAMGETVNLGRRVVVIGGGFTAVDASRTARRLGAEEVSIVYRRSRAEMPAHHGEVAEAEEEGVQLQLLAAPVRMVAEGGRATGLECVRMTLGEPDARGRRRPVPLAGSEFFVPADTIIAAIGQTPSLEFLQTEKMGREIATETMTGIAAHPFTQQTHVGMVFAGGDAVTGAATVVQAVAAGKRAYQAIDAYLSGGDMATIEKELAAAEAVPEFLDIVPYKPKAARAVSPVLAPEERVKSFAAVEVGLDEAAVRREAQRCLQCTCAAHGECDLQRLGLAYGLTANRFHREAETTKYHDYKPDYSHPLVVRDLNKCIRCDRCVRMCRDVLGQEVFDMIWRGFDAIPATAFDRPLGESECSPDSCTACVETCPTGALMLRQVVKEKNRALAMRLEWD